jgi:hypothetical protein
VVVVDEHVCSLRREEAGACRTDATRGAGDDNALACKPGVHAGVRYPA